MRSARADSVNRIRKSARQASVTDWLMVIFTFLIFVTTAIYTHYAKKQWAEMHTSGTDTHTLALAAKAQAEAAQSQVKKMKESIGKTGELAIEARRSADYAEKGIAIAEQEVKVSQRAWIAIGVHGLLTPSTCTIHISFINTGRSPAINVRYLEAVDSDIQPPLLSTLVEPKADPTFPIPPNSTFTEDLPVDFCVKGGARILSSRKLNAVLHGSVWYDDIFHHHHWVKFSFNYYTSGSIHGFSVGNSGNKVDDDPE